MKKWFYSSIVFLLILTGCAQKNSEEVKTANETIQKDINKEDFINELALHDAVRAKDFAVVQELVNNDSSIDTKDKYGYTPLHLAARLNQYDIAELLIKKGANVNNVDIYKDTPLLDSTRNSTNPMSKLLLCNGANKNVIDRHKMSPLHNASKNNDIFIVQMIEADDLTKYCENLDITLDYYDENENKICGSIKMGVATKVDLIIVDETSENDEPFGKYKAKLSDDSYCAKLDKKIDKNANYIVTAVGTNSVDKDIEVANLKDLVKEEASEPVQTEYITGLYEDLMEEFGPDFEPWNAELDKNGLVFRFKNPGVLFNRGSSDLRVKFKEILDDFFPRYLKVLNKYTNEIEKVRVEGHTSSEFRRAKNDEQRYAMNKALSEKRANEVLTYTLENLSQIVGDTKPWLDTVYESEGMAYDDLIYNADGTENKVLSRRVEFRINKIQQ